MTLWNATPNHSGSVLPLPIAPTKECEIRLTPGRLEKPTLRIIFPEDTAVAPYPSFRPRIEYTVGSTVRDIRFVVDGKVLFSGTGSKSPTLTVPKSIKVSGAHTLDVILIDQYFNEVKKNVSFRFGEDRSPPSVRITSPKDGATVHRSEKLLLRADAEDAEGGMKYVQFFLNDRLLSNDPALPYELSYDADLKAGQYTLRVKATDLAGNSAEDTAVITVE